MTLCVKRFRPNTLCVRSKPILLSNKNYFNSTTAPASSSCFFKASASSLETASLTVAGTESTKSLASFNPFPVNSFTNLTTANLDAPLSFKITSNSVCSSAASPPPAATITAAAAGSIPYSSFKIVDNSLTSNTVKFTNSSANFFKSAILIFFVCQLFNMSVSYSSDAPSSFTASLFSN